MLFSSHISRDMNVNQRFAVVWDDRWIRFRMALEQKGVKPKFQEYYRAWVLGFFGFIEPKKVAELAIENVEKSVAKLSAEGKKERRQKEWPLRLVFRRAWLGCQAALSSSQARAFV